MLDRRQCLGFFAAGMLAPATAFAQTPDISSAGKGKTKDPLANRFGGPFSLTDHHGKRVTELSWPGQFLLVYFGFTRCTDACPVDMPNLVQGLDLLAPLDARIQPLFVTVDADDTPAVLKTYVEAFHPRLAGLTGSEAELAAMAKTYRVHRYRVALKSGQTGQKFTINHGSLTYLIGPNGDFLTLIPHAAGGKRIAEILRKYVTTA